MTSTGSEEDERWFFGKITSDEAEKTLFQGKFIYFNDR